MRTANHITPEPATPESHLIVEEFLKNTANYERYAIEGTILFADLVGSTAFKRYHSPLDGLAKTLLHNRVASQSIIENGGRVIKYIGDSVMGLFLADPRHAQGIQCALKILEDIQFANRQMAWSYPKEMSTRVGVNSGLFWMFKYKVSGAEDPQGAEVDLAARICKLAGPQQVVCTEATYQAAGGSTAFGNATQPITRSVSGVKEMLKVRVVMPSGWPCNPPPGEEGTIRGVPEHFDAALRLLRENRNNEALADLKRIIADDPTDFHANVYIADILIDQLEKTPHFVDQTILSEAEESLLAAKTMRPQASRVWLLLSRLKRREFDVRKTPDSLQSATKHARNAVECAKNGHDRGAELEGKTQLASCLCQLSLLNHEEIQGDLGDARALCAELAGITEEFTGKFRKEYLVTHALVRLVNGDSMFSEIERMLNEALKIDRNYDKAYEALAELARRRNQPPGSTMR